LKVYFETLGCKLNQFETEALINLFKQKGFDIVFDIKECDVVVVNTCTVTKKSETKSFNAIKKAKRENKLVVATGCYATTDYDYLKKDLCVDIVVKNDDKFKIPEIITSKENLLRKGFIERIEPVGVSQGDTPSPSEKGFIDRVEPVGVSQGDTPVSPEKGCIDKIEPFVLVSSFERTRAFIKIQDGCNKFCSYCKIPFARGRSKSLDPEKILSFTEELVKKDYKEIVLTGVNISDYNYNGYKLYNLVKDIIEVNGNFRIRLSSLQPDEFDKKMIDFLNNEKFCPHFHISLQSGSNSVLKRMHRNYTKEYFLELTKQIRMAKKDTGITTDIIVGFPLETDDEFNETLKLVEMVEFSRLHIFAYSKREHTKASLLDDLPREIKKMRGKILERKFKDVVSDFVRREIIGKPQKILIEEKKDNLYTGYTGNYFKFYTRKDNLCLNNFYSLIPVRFEIKNTSVELYDY